ncbi:MAG: hypothetical protein HOP15_05870 [Planctomycetes bacterium]|nr:hypothetical protein [Planctomycetota bacterium]
MNRGTVVLVALAILLAHTFAIHQTPDGDFAAPYEMAHVAYRLGRNLVYEGSASWNPGGPAIESYPSPIWVLLAAVAARLYASPIFLTQAVGLVSVLATLVVLAQFSPKRTAGLVAPVLLAASGSTAAAAFSGTEAALAMLLVSTAFLAFERGWFRLLALALSALLLTRPEGGCALLFLLACERVWRPRSEDGPRRPGWRAYLLPSALIVLATLARRTFTGHWLSPFSAPLAELDLARWRIGAEYLASFAISSGFGLLFLVVVLSLSAGRTSAMGTRALGLAGTWWGVVALSGGDELPFWSALVPVLPLFFLGVQECLRVWMDERPSLAHVAWPVLSVSLLAAFLASKVPGDIGPLRLQQALTDWQTPRGALAKAYPRPLGRLGLLEEIRAVEHLRTLGVYLRDRVGADATILTSWPGAIGYLSRKEVLDLSGRVWPLAGYAQPFSWRGVTRVDVAASLAEGIDYIVPLVGTLSETDEPDDFLVSWLERYDRVGPTPHRQGELLHALSNYTLVSVPVPAESRRPNEPSDRPFPLLQRKQEGMIPRLVLEVEEGRLRVLARHEGHHLVVDLCLSAKGRDGRELYLRPTGSWVRSAPLDARTSLLVFPTGTSSIQLLEAPVPAELRGAEVRAWLHNPGMRPDAPLSPLGEPVSAVLE